jgi:hypothetical protein
VWLAAGLLVGAGHLARADGVILLVPIAGLAAFSPRRRLPSMALLTVGYLLVMAPWMSRNLSITGTLMGTGGARTLWLTSYDELFAYPASSINFGRWAAQGLGEILAARAQALAANLKTLVVVLGGVIIRPFMPAAHAPAAEPLVVVSRICTLLGASTVAFPSRSTGAVPQQCSNPVGLAPSVQRVLEWVAKWGWEAGMAPLPRDRTRDDRIQAGWLGPRAAAPASRWQASADHHRAVAEAVLRLDPSPGVVAINDPPGFYLASGLPCVVVPYGDQTILREVAERCDVEWCPNTNHPAPLAMYADPSRCGGLR